MPKQTPREPGVESLASRRIRYERDRRGWSTAELARRVTDAGCKINQSSVWAIESAGRRISLAEAVGFAAAFGITLDDLMVAPGDLKASAQALTRLLRGLNQMESDVRQLLEDIRQAAKDAPELVGAAMPAIEYLGLGDTRLATEELQTEMREVAALLLSVTDALATQDRRIVNQIEQRPATEH